MGELPDAVAAPTASRRRARIVLAQRVPVYLALTLVALLGNYLTGKEMAWDSVDYHLYDGFSALHDRFALDYFAAGAQSYFNPYAYVPFYLLVSTGLPALLIASLLAIVHSVILWLSFELGALACPVAEEPARSAAGLYTAAFAYLSPVLFQQIGSSFADITTGTLALGGWLLIARALKAPRASLVAWAGLLLGAAVGLKPTNAVHALSGCVLLLFIPQSLVARCRSGVLYGAALVLGTAMVMASWSFRLERNFGNPFFPLLNTVFRSPDFTTEPLRHFRFIPEGLSEFLWRPFAIAVPRPLVQEELLAPDIRYAVLLLLIAALAIAHWLRQRRARRIPAFSAQSPGAEDWRVFTALVAAFAVDWTLWLTESGNGRYFLPMACVASALVVGSLFGLRTRPAVRNVLLVAVLAVQAMQLWQGTDHRWKEGPWDGPWLSVSLPAQLTTQPALYLSVGAQSNSFLAPYLPQGSGMSNFSGGYALDPGGNGKPLAALIERYSPHLRVLATGARLYDDDAGREPTLSRVDSALQRFGLRVAPDDCATITIRGLPHDPEIRRGSSVDGIPPADSTYLVTCAVVPDRRDHSAARATQREIDQVLDRVEDACPQLFQPRRMQTERAGMGWQRTYANTDLVLWISNGQVKFSDRMRGDGEIRALGPVHAWVTTALQIDCGRRAGTYFAQLVDSQVH
jgi:hypothetical protein